MTVVDSSSWIEAFRDRGDPEVKARVARLLDAGDAAWCQIIRLELWRGVRSAGEKRKIEFLESRITMLQINDHVWNHAIELSTKARDNGLTMPVTDILIAATAVHHGAAIEHRDEHLFQLAKLMQ